MNRSDIRIYSIATATWLVAFLGLGGAFVG